MAKALARNDAPIAARPGARIDHRVLLIAALVLLQTLDVVTTSIGLRVGLAEANGVAAHLFNQHGEFPVYGLKALVTLIIVASVLLLQRRYPRIWISVRVITAMMFIVVTSNVLNIVLGN